MKAINVLRGFLSESPSAVYPAEVLEYVDAIERELEAEYVPLPKDADGVPIHIGDKVYENENYHERMSFMWLTEEGWVPCCFDCVCESLHHYKPPTVEDVLREFVFDVCGDSTPEEAVVKRFTERLQLREVVE